VNVLGIICALLAIAFVAFLSRVWSRIRDRKFLRAGFYTLPACIAFLSLFLLLLVLSNLTTYQRLTYERDIARLSIKKVSEQNFQINLAYVESSENVEPNEFLLQGDEWRLEAKILKWHGWANLIGLDSYYQLDRISGRYRDIELATSKPASAFQLSKVQRGINLWRLKRLMRSNLPFLDAYFGQGLFLPMRDGAAFMVAINQSGLIARPANELGQQALDGW